MGKVTMHTSPKSLESPKHKLSSYSAEKCPRSAKLLKIDELPPLKRKGMLKENNQSTASPDKVSAVRSEVEQPTEDPTHKENSTKKRKKRTKRRIAAFCKVCNERKIKVYEDPQKNSFRHYQCVLCSLKSTSCHIFSMHNCGSASSLYKCIGCRKFYEDYSVFLEHISNNHPNIPLSVKMIGKFLMSEQCHIIQKDGGTLTLDQLVKLRCPTSDICKKTKKTKKCDKSEQSSCDIDYSDGFIDENLIVISEDEEPEHSESLLSTISCHEPSFGGHSFNDIVSMETDNRAETESVDVREYADEIRHNSVSPPSLHPICADITDSVNEGNIFDLSFSNTTELPNSPPELRPPSPIDSVPCVIQIPEIQGLPFCDSLEEENPLIIDENDNTIHSIDETVEKIPNDSETFDTCNVIESIPNDNQTMCLQDSNHTTSTHDNTSIPEDPIANKPIETHEFQSETAESSTMANIFSMFQILPETTPSNGQTNQVGDVKAKISKFMKSAKKVLAAKTKSSTIESTELVNTDAPSNNVPIISDEGPINTSMDGVAADVSEILDTSSGSSDHHNDQPMIPTNPNSVEKKMANECDDYSVFTIPSSSNRTCTSLDTITSLTESCIGSVDNTISHTVTNTVDTDDTMSVSAEDSAISKLSDIFRNDNFDDENRLIPLEDSEDTTASRNFVGGDSHDIVKVLNGKAVEYTPTVPNSECDDTSINNNYNMHAEKTSTTNLPNVKTEVSIADPTDAEVPSVSQPIVKHEMSQTQVEVELPELILSENTIGNVVNNIIKSEILDTSISTDNPIDILSKMSELDDVRSRLEAGSDNIDTGNIDSATSNMSQYGQEVQEPEPVDETPEKLAEIFNIKPPTPKPKSPHPKNTAPQPHHPARRYIYQDGHWRNVQGTSLPDINQYHRETDTLMSQLLTEEQCPNPAANPAADRCMNVVEEPPYPALNPAQPRSRRMSQPGYDQTNMSHILRTETPPDDDYPSIQPNQPANHPHQPSSHPNQSAIYSSQPSSHPNQSAIYSSQPNKPSCYSNKPSSHPSTHGSTRPSQSSSHPYSRQLPQSHSPYLYPLSKPNPYQRQYSNPTQDFRVPQQSPTYINPTNKPIQRSSNSRAPYRAESTPITPPPSPLTSPSIPELPPNLSPLTMHKSSSHPIISPPMRQRRTCANMPPVSPLYPPLYPPHIPSQGAPMPHQGAPMPYQGAPMPSQGAPMPHQGAPMPHQGAPKPTSMRKSSTSPPMRQRRASATMPPMYPLPQIPPQCATMPYQCAPMHQSAPMVPQGAPMPRQNSAMSVRNLPTKRFLPSDGPYSIHMDSYYVTNHAPRNVTTNMYPPSYTHGHYPSTPVELACSRLSYPSNRPSYSSMPTSTLPRPRNIEEFEYNHNNQHIDWNGVFDTAIDDMLTKFCTDTS